jgi:hypothetical protein
MASAIGHLENLLAFNSKNKIFLFFVCLWNLSHDIHDDAIRFMASIIDV